MVWEKNQSFPTSDLGSQYSGGPVHSVVIFTKKMSFLWTQADNLPSVLSKTHERAQLCKSIPCPKSQYMLLQLAADVSSLFAPSCQFCSKWEELGLHILSLRPRFRMPILLIIFGPFIVIST